MIRQDEVFPIGTLYKPHGVNGEINFGFTDSVFEEAESPYIVLEMEGILVPFFLESIRSKSSEVSLLKLEGIDDEPSAKKLSNKTVYYPTRFASDEISETSGWNRFVGYRIEDEVHGLIGIVSEVDDSTLNILFRIENEGNEILMPIADEFLREHDPKKRILTVCLPEGFLEL